MIKIGLVGIGFMGMIHYLAAKKLPGVKVAAVCSRDRLKLSGDWRSIRGNFGPPGEQMDLSGIKKYERYEDLLADPEIDLVDICNPTHLHAETAIAALKAGKPVLVEKAIALTTHEADAMMAAAKESGKLLMVAHVLPFFPDFAFAAKMIREETYGKLLAGHLRRVISRPDWSAEIGDAAKTGGPALDLHIHDTHFVRMIFGMPRSVFSSGCIENGVVEHLTTHYHYLSGPAITSTCGAIAAKARPFVHGYELFFEKATCQYESGAVPLTIYHGDGRIEHPKLASSDPIDSFSAEIAMAASSIESGKAQVELDGLSARDALVLCYKEIESVKTGQIVPI